ncbi:MAG: phage portal protein [Prolixibacteraceae bacterium]
MKTIREITDKGRPADQVIADLKKKNIEVPAWGLLEKEYDPKKHPIKTDPLFLDKVTKGGITKVSKITLGLQRLATNRITELMYGIPVKRIYKTGEDENMKRAADIMEKIFQKNRIDAVNLDRGKKLFCACEVVTLWYAQLLEQEHKLYGEPTKIKLRCKTYSPKDGDALYPLFDESDDMIALSIEYTRKEGSKTIRYFDTYSADQHLRWADGVEEVREDIGLIEIAESVESGEPVRTMKIKEGLGKIPGVYIYRPTPIWEDQSENVYEAEYALSRQGNYIRKNSKPIFGVFSDGNVKYGGEDDKDDRLIVQYGKDDDAKYITWEQAIDSLKFYKETLFDSFFTELQLPNISFDKMMSEAMSGESRKWVFVDAQMKVTDEAGSWLEFFDREINVVRAWMKIMYPDLSDAIDELDIELKITPYSITDEKELIENLTTAAGGEPILSQEEAVRQLGYVDDVEDEIKRLKAQSAKNIFEPAE